MQLWAVVSRLSAATRNTHFLGVYPARQGKKPARFSHAGHRSHGCGVVPSQQFRPRTNTACIAAPLVFFKKGNTHRFEPSPPSTSAMRSFATVQRSLTHVFHLGGEAWGCGDRRGAMCECLVAFRDRDKAAQPLSPRVVRGRNLCRYIERCTQPRSRHSPLPLGPNLRHKV
jgi:hypothetical protein